MWGEGGGRREAGGLTLVGEDGEGGGDLQQHADLCTRGHQNEHERLLTAAICNLLPTTAKHDYRSNSRLQIYEKII